MERGEVEGGNRSQGSEEKTKQQVALHVAT